MKKRIVKECKILVRVREYENIEFRSSGEIDIEFSSEEERMEKERQFWREIVGDIKDAMTEWSGQLRHGGNEAAREFLKNSHGAVAAKVEQKNQ